MPKGKGLPEYLAANSVGQTIEVIPSESGTMVAACRATSTRSIQTALAGQT